MSDLSDGDGRKLEEGYEEVAEEWGADLESDREFSEAGWGEPIRSTAIRDRSDGRAWLSEGEREAG